MRHGSSESARVTAVAIWTVHVRNEHSEDYVVFDGCEQDAVERTVERP